jgi:hypothetical protein
VEARARSVVQPDGRRPADSLAAGVGQIQENAIAGCLVLEIATIYLC